MTKIEQDKIFQEYINAAMEHGQATLEGNYKVANKQYARLKIIFKKFEKDHLLADNLLETLFQNSNVSVRIWAATHALKLSIRTNEAEKLLKEISRDNSLGIFRLDSEMVLKEWEKAKHN